MGSFYDEAHVPVVPYGWVWLDGERLDSKNVLDKYSPTRDLAMSGF